MTSTPRVSISRASTSTNSSTNDILVWRRLQLSKAKLEGVTEMAALMAGFSVIATVELQIGKGTPQSLLVFFTVTTALLVSTTMLSIMIATCILPHVEAVVEMSMDTDPVGVKRSASLGLYIDLAWFLANTASILLFIMDVILLSWIKFRASAAIAVTSIMIPVLLLLVLFSVIFYRETVHQKIHLADRELGNLMEISERLEEFGGHGQGQGQGQSQSQSQDREGSSAGSNRIDMKVLHQTVIV